MLWILLIYMQNLQIKMNLVSSCDWTDQISPHIPG